MWTVELIVMAVMIVINAVFAAYEIALASVRQATLAAFKGNRAGAAAALRMKENMEASLAVVQLGITLVAAIAAATGGAGAEESLAPVLREAGLSYTAAEFVAIAAVVLPLTVVTITFGELVPKVFALRNKEWVCLRLSRPMEWFAYVVWPAVWLFETSVTLIMKWGERRFKPSVGEEDPQDVSLQELRAAAALARTSRLIGRREEGIIINAARLSSTPVRSIMLGSEHISMLHADSSLADALIAAHQEMHTRYPVTAVPGDPQEIVGYVNFKDIVACLRMSPHEPSLRAVLRPLSSFNARDSVAKCLEQMIRKHTHIALVRNRSGEVLGMITMEDVLEELVGEIHDEYDRLAMHLIPTGAGWIVGGGVKLAKVQEATGLEIPTSDDKADATFHDWVVQQLGRPPRGGDRIATDSISVLIHKVRRQLLLEALLSRRV